MSQRGGKRPGSGAKAKDGATLANTMQVCARIRKDQHAGWLALGGSEWLRAQIDAADALKELKGEK